MDEMTADLIGEGTLKGLESARTRGQFGDRPSIPTELQVLKAREMYDDRGKRKYTVAQIGQTFGVSRKTIYRHLDRHKRK
jgi:DNA invertase Pin-like site-specific DNA recombinase